MLLFKVISLGARGTTRRTGAERASFGLVTKTGNGKDWIKCSAPPPHRVPQITPSAAPPSAMAGCALRVAAAAAGTVALWRGLAGSRAARRRGEGSAASGRDGRQKRGRAGGRAVWDGVRVPVAAAACDRDSACKSFSSRSFAVGVIIPFRVEWRRPPFSRAPLTATHTRARARNTYTHVDATPPYIIIITIIRVVPSSLFSAVFQTTTTTRAASVTFAATTR